MRRFFFHFASLLFLTTLFLSCEKEPPANLQARIPDLIPRATESQPSAEYLAMEKAISQCRANIIADPDDVENYTALANLFLQESRMSGNHHDYLPKATQLIEKAKALAPDDFMTNVTYASILMIQHRFKAAQKVIEGVIGKKTNAHAYGVLCDVYVELGEYEKAVAACDKMLSIRPDLRSYARASYLRELHGDIDGAIEAMEMAVNAGMPGRENRAWALYQLGNLHFQRGAMDTAAYIFEGILKERPTYANAKYGLAKIKRAEQDYSAAIDLVLEAMLINPDHQLTEALAAIYRDMGEKENARQMIKTAQAAFREHEEEGWNINLDYAFFCLAHDIETRETLTRIEKEYQQRPGNIEVLASYAGALHKNGQSETAIPYIEQALQVNNRRSDWLHLAGEIHDKSGNDDAALAYFEKALQEKFRQDISDMKHARQRIASIRGIAGRAF